MDMKKIYNSTEPKTSRLRNASTSEIVDNYLTAIDEGKSLNAFISIFGREAKSKAQKLDRKISVKTAPKLGGKVIAVKDNINIAGHKTTCASKILSDFISPYDATVIQKLKLCDAIFIGKTNMDEFAMGSSNETSYFGPVKNPHDVSRVPGGSSGGSAAAVAAGMTWAALGSDTGGSVRQPASFCGVVGLKPTYGRVSRYGLVAFASSLDQIGPIAKNVSDCAVLLKIIAGHDPSDATSANIPVTDYSQHLGRPIAAMKIGIPIEYFGEGTAPHVKKSVEHCISILKNQGVEVIEISLPRTEYAIATYYIIATAEASSNLARYDGVRFGHRSQTSTSLEETYIKSRREGFGEEVKRRIMLGTFVLSTGYYDAYYRRAQQFRTLIRQDFESAFQQCDCILTPTSPTTAFHFGEKIKDPLTMYLSDIFTVSANLAGIPAISIPCGFDENGLPIGAQLMAAHFRESLLFQIGHALEQQLEL